MTYQLPYKEDVKDNILR